MAEEYGIDRQRIYSFRRRGWSLEDAMQMCINDVRGRGRLFEYNGKLYRSPKALAEEYGLPWNSLAHYIQRCKTIEEAVDRCKETQEKKIMLWGKRYQSRYALAIAFGIRETSISARIHTRNMTFIINQRIIAGNAQFTGIAAGQGVGFTTGLLLLREGLGMRETPIRPHS